MSKYYLVFFALICISFPLSAIENKNGEQYLKEIRKVTGDNVNSAIDGKLTNDKIGGRFDNYLDTVIWNDTFTKETDKIKQIQNLSVAMEEIPMDSPIDKMNQEWLEEEARLAELKQLESNKTKEIPNIFAGGYCNLDNQISISKSNEFSKLDCYLDFGQGNYRRVEVFVSLYPDYKREMIIAIPIYVAFENKNRATFSGVVLKEDKISMNIAGWVDNMRIQKLIGEGLLSTNSTIYNYVSGYMNALQQSRRQTDVEYITTTNALGIQTTTPIQTTTIEKPRPKDYLIAAGVEIFSNLFANKGKDYLYSKEPLFKVFPQKVYIEGVVSFDKEGLAQRFGQISNNEVKKSNQNSKSWIDNRNSIINKYDRTFESNIQ